MALTLTYLEIFGLWHSKCHPPALEMRACQMKEFEQRAVLKARQDEVTSQSTQPNHYAKDGSVQSRSCAPRNARHEDDDGIG
jgi:hypothetical protein